MLDEVLVASGLGEPNRSSLVGSEVFALIAKPLLGSDDFDGRLSFNVDAVGLRPFFGTEC